MENKIREININKGEIVASVPCATIINSVGSYIRLGTEPFRRRVIKEFSIYVDPVKGLIPPEKIYENTVPDYN